MLEQTQSEIIKSKILEKTESENINNKMLEKTKSEYLNNKKLEQAQPDFEVDESASNESFYDEKIKIMVIGEVRVGKTSLISKFTKNVFGGNYLTTVGIDFQVKTVNVNGKAIKVQIWDTAGEERFRNIATNYFKSSDGFLIVYYIIDKNTFEKLDFWFEQINLNVPENIRYVLVGNKCDLEGQREVNKDEGINRAKEFNCEFYETSAKEGTNVNEIFQCLVSEIYEQVKKNNNNRNRRASQVLKKQETTKKKSCC